MENGEKVRFEMYEMAYEGGIVEPDILLIPFEEAYYEPYKRLVDDCFYPMRRALGIRPYEEYCDTLETLMAHKDQIYLLPDGEEIICAVTCLAGQIENVVVGAGYRRQGYGRRLMAFALSVMLGRGDAGIRLTVTKWNTGAIALYESLGFTVTKEAAVHGVNTRDADGRWRFEITDTGGLDVS